MSFQRPTASAQQPAAAPDHVRRFPWEHQTDTRPTCDTSLLDSSDSTEPYSQSRLYPSPVTPNPSPERKQSYLQKVKNRLSETSLDQQRALVTKLRLSRRPLERVSSFSDLTFSWECLKDFGSNPALKEAVSEESPITREFNRLFESSAKWDQRKSLESLEPISGSFDSNFVDLPKATRAERPKKLFENETCYQRGGREAALQELDRLEVELEDVKVALEADSSALYGGVDADHWSLSVSVDSGVFNRMSSGDSGPLSGEFVVKSVNKYS